MLDGPGHNRNGPGPTGVSDQIEDGFNNDLLRFQRNPSKDVLILRRQESSVSVFPPTKLRKQHTCQTLDSDGPKRAQSVTSQRDGRVGVVNPDVDSEGGEERE